MSENKEITRKAEQAPARPRQEVFVTPAVDIFENKDELLVIAEVPGVPKDGVNLRFDKDQLFIEAKATLASESLTPLFREFSAVTFRRAFELAPGIDVEKISADLKAGLLSIRLPKAESLKPRQIPISVG